MFDPSTVTPRSRQSRRRRHHNDRRAAVRRAIIGAKLLLGLPLDVTSQAKAAAAVGVSLRHITAAVALLRVEDDTLVDRVLRGAMPLRAAARDAGKRGNLVAAYRAASAEDRIALARTVGAAALWDQCLVPVL